ncbi:MAG: Ig-like domain-containing protein, partial [Burkholderiales bacterium]|nr:Ig-like domain-containing protein [Burkholderiales bacterium]
MSTNLLKIYWIFWLAIMVVGCGGSGNSSDTSAKGTSVTMDSNHGGFSNNASLKPIIVLSFSAPMNPATINPDTVLLSTSANPESSNSIMLDNLTSNQTNTVFSTSPINPLSGQTKYYVTVKDAVKDQNGNSVVAQFTFTTGDLTAPMVSILNPNNNDQDITTQPTIQLKFSENVSNVDSTNVMLYDGEFNPVPLGSIILGANNTYTFSTTKSLKELTTYHLVLNSKIIDSAGNKLNNITFNFTTGDFTLPAVNIIAPSNNEYKVSKTPNIKITFSENVNNVNSDNITLHANSPTGESIPIGTITLGSKNTYTFSPIASLNESTVYYVVIESGIVDNKQHNLVKTIFNFTTGDFTSPIVSIIKPNSNTNNVSVSPTIQLHFSEKVTNVNSNNITLHKASDGQIIPITSIILGDDNNYTFSSINKLTENTTYYIMVESEITDFESNRLAKYTFRFTTGDFTAPTVGLVQPSNNANNVSLTPNIQITFSESVNYVDINNIKLRANTPTGTSLPINSIIKGPNDTYTFSPVTQLAENTPYYLIVESGIADPANNQLIRTIFSFTTGDFTAPQVSLINPNNNGSNISLNPTIKLKFSEPV